MNRSTSLVSLGFIWLHWRCSRPVSCLVVPSKNRLNSYQKFSFSNKEIVRWQAAAVAPISIGISIMDCDKPKKSARARIRQQNKSKLPYFLERAFTTFYMILSVQFGPEKLEFVFSSLRFHRFWQLFAKRIPFLCLRFFFLRRSFTFKLCNFFFCRRASITFQGNCSPMKMPKVLSFHAHCSPLFFTMTFGTDDTKVLLSFAFFLHKQKVNFLISFFVLDYFSFFFFRWPVRWKSSILAKRFTKLTN